MSKEKRSTGAKSRKHDDQIVLAAVLDAPQGMELHAALAPFLEATAPVLLNAGKVERVDSLALQVLLAFVMARRSAGQAVEWSQVSTEFRRATDLLGMSQSLGLASA